jgi:hypothetical protein
MTQGNAHLVFALPRSVNRSRLLLSRGQLVQEGWHDLREIQQSPEQTVHGMLHRTALHWMDHTLRTLPSPAEHSQDAREAYSFWHVGMRCLSTYCTGRNHTFRAHRLHLSYEAVQQHSTVAWLPRWERALVRGNVRHSHPPASHASCPAQYSARLRCIRKQLTPCEQVTTVKQQPQLAIAQLS